MKKSYLIELIYIFDNELKNIQSNVQLSNMPVPLKKKRLDQLSDAINSWAEVKNLVAAYIDGETEWDLMLETAVKKKADMTKMLKDCISEIGNPKVEIPTTIGKDGKARPTKYKTRAKKVLP